MSTNTFWSAELQQMPATAPAVIGDTVIVASQDSGMTALHTTLRGYDLNSGEVKWQQTLEYGLVTGLSSYTAEKQRPLVLITTMGSDFLNGEAGLWAIDESGSEVWRWDGDGESFSDTMIYYDAQLANHLAICTIDASMLLVVHPLNGKQKAYVSISSDTSIAAPAYHNGVVILPTRGPEVTAVDLEGQQRWQYKSSESVWFDKTPVVIGSYVIVTSSQGIAAGIDLLTGVKKWEKAIDPAGKTLSPAATDGALAYVGSRDGLHALDPGLGKALWTAPL
ncbi:MAG: PQQ-like beta-propeller repeat protein, partial [Anaerolineales bacterium]|nr:PQQ-like beta-propeller repeat protein [Anaerolineales bacterium]